VAKKRLSQPKEEPARPKPKKTVLTEERLLPSESLLSSESLLPRREEVARKWMDEAAGLEDQGGALPVQHHRPGQALWSVASCDARKGECKGELKGDGTGTRKPLTPLERMVRELTIASAMLNGEFNHDLARKDGKRFGIVGGDNEDGVDSAIVQAAVAITQVASAVVVGQAQKFAKKLEEACAKKAPLLLEGAEKVSKKTAKFLAKLYGKDIAHGLEQNGAIGAYDVMREFTRGLEGSYQAHHILEKAMGRELGLTKKQLDKIPSVILTEAQHKKITKLLDALRPPPSKVDPNTLWKMYKKAYKDYPHWLKSIEPYFGK